MRLLHDSVRSIDFREVLVVIRSEGVFFLTVWVGEVDGRGDLALLIVFSWVYFEKNLTSCYCADTLSPSNLLRSFTCSR